MTNYCGYIALVGRPNVGKSTLLNKVLDRKLSITSRKPQTTRHRILGVRTDDNFQFVYVDTPGIHLDEKKTINKIMNKTALNVLHDVDVIVFVLDGTRFTKEDEYVLDVIKKSNMPCILVVNKVDKVSDKSSLLPKIHEISQLHNFIAIVPLSAKTGLQVDNLHEEIKPYLPEGPHLFPVEQTSDRSNRFLCSELVREKIFRLCDQEVPYSVTVNIESFEEEDNIYKILALILVDKENHKRMIIGDKGAKLKDIATRARIDMEKLLNKKVFLRCFCKVKSGWSDNEKLLKELGYDE